MHGYDDLAVFVAVARAGSFVGAARALGMPMSTVSRRITELEKRLGARLLNRTTRAVSLTDDGKAYWQRCAAAFEEIDSASNALLERTSHLIGAFRVTAPVLAGRETIGPWMLDFMSEHPDLELDLRLTNANIDLVEESIDLAFRLGPLREGSHVAKLLWHVPYVLVAAKESRAAMASLQLKHPRDLARVRQVFIPPMHTWTFVNDAGVETIFTPRAPAASIGDLQLGCEAVRRGVGLGYLPRAMVQGELGDALVEVKLSGWRPVDRILYALYPASRQLSPKVRAAIDYVVERRKRAS